MALLRQGKFLEVAHIRPEWKRILLRSKLLTKIKIDGKEHLTDRTHYLREPE
jgi:hypothetical protein